MKKSMIQCLFVIFLCVWAFGPAAEAATIFMNFGGDANATFDFINITVSHDTGPLGTGLGNFTGSAFGYTTAAQELALETAILTRVQADYAPYNLTFSTSQPAGTVGTNFVVWGIDDTAFTFSNCCPSTGLEENRLFGKVDANPGTYARTWAGSFSLDGVTNPYGGGATSNPQLDSSTHTVDQIAQALANSAAHEIAHLFGVLHEGLDDGLPSVPWSLMETNIESIMASTDKVFSATADAQLLSFLGPAQNGVPVPEPASLVLLGSGLVASSLVAWGRRRRRE